MTDKKNSGQAKSRHKARELALQTLYACEVSGMDEWKTMLECIGEGRFVAPENMHYAAELVGKTIASLARIDETITRHAANWEMKRMAALDRNVLRLATAELFFSTMCRSRSSSMRRWSWRKPTVSTSRESLSTGFSIPSIRSARRQRSPAPPHREATRVNDA